MDYPPCFRSESEKRRAGPLEEMRTVRYQPLWNSLRTPTDIAGM